MATDTNQQWYYAEGTSQRGPVSAEDFVKLLASGTIRADTLVWTSGMDAWKPYGQLSGAPVLAETDGATATCGMCGKALPKAELMVYDNLSVCADCKPDFVQKLKENAEVSVLFRYAGFWIRVAATIIDSMITSTVNYAIILPLQFFVFKQASQPGAPTGAMIATTAVTYLIAVTLSLLYSTLLVGKYGATLGKMACGLKVVMPDGSRVTYGRACGRYFANMLSGMCLYIGYLMVAFDKQEHRALHDRICNTRVIFAKKV